MDFFERWIEITPSFWNECHILNEHDLVPDFEATLLISNSNGSDYENAYIRIFGSVFTRSTS